LQKLSLLGRATRNQPAGNGLDKTALVYRPTTTQMSPMLLGS